jgi:protein tyrosine phosphatase (PTP) superfamily phosphohydrolase (DUF442 family)
MKTMLSQFKPNPSNPSNEKLPSRMHECDRISTLESLNSKMFKAYYSKNMKMHTIFTEILLYWRSLQQIVDSRLRPKMGIEGILNYRCISDSIATSGQPTVKEFELIYRAGFNTVVNLAPTNTFNALPNEQAIVIALGIEYINIPVIWENPTIEDFSRFCIVMNAHQQQSIYIHCAMNMRVSVFVYLYRHLILEIPASEAYQPVTTLWQPNETWQKFIETAIASHQN